MTLNVKFVKQLLTTGSMTTTQAGRFYCKLFYEFWGFCVNGGTSLTNPGGFAYVNFPTDFQSGSLILLASGSDGETTYDSNLFSSPSSNFPVTGSQMWKLIDRYLVTWKSGSSSTDDSIYRILGVQSPTQLVVDPITGGSPRQSAKPVLTDRTGINWRLVDIAAAINLSGWVDGQGCVCNLTAAPEVNPGSQIAQFQLSVSSSQTAIGLRVSNNSSWNGSTLVSGAAELTRQWFYTDSPGVGTLTLIGSRDFCISHVLGYQGAWTSLSGSGLHVEVPELFRQSSDSNPVAFINWTNAPLSQVSNSYHDWQVTSQQLTASSTHSLLVRSIHGGAISPLLTPVSGGLYQGLPQRYSSAYFNTKQVKVLTSDGILASVLPAKYTLTRVRLRRVRFGSSWMLRSARIGSYPNSWIHVSNGICWPWDGTEIPFGLLSGVVT